MRAVAVLDVLQLFKLRIGAAIALAAAGGLALSAGPLPRTRDMVVLVVAVLLASAAAGAVNHYVERDLDRRMRRTAGRPFAAGRLRPHPLWPAAFGALLVAATGLAWSAAGAASAAFVLAGALTYSVVYTLWLKPRTVWNIVVGGLAGSFAVLAGGAAGGLSFEVLVLAVVLFLWTPPHFWSLAMAVREDYAAAGVPMLPVVVGEGRCARIVAAHTLVLVALSLLPALGRAGFVYLAAALAGGLWFAVESLRLVRDPRRRQALRTFFASLAQLALLLSGAIADRLLGGS